MSPRLLLGEASLVRRYMITIAVAFLVFAGTMLHLQVPAL